MTNSCFQDTFDKACIIPRLYEVRTAGKKLGIMALSMQDALLAFWELFPELGNNAVQVRLAPEWEDDA